MEKPKIILISCGLFENDLTGRIEEDISHEFHYPVHLEECNLDLSRFYNPGRRQYNANGILKVLLDVAPREAVKTMGLLRVDLYIPILTYIFGQAALNGNSGIASLYRLRNELYGIQPDNALLIDRFSKVIIHELGHSFGLIHCTYPVCIMRSSTYVEDLDQKEKHFCYNCQAELNRKKQLGL
ncbi:MAG: archaemetzincin family Zn-dependent metalloprotease [Bacteroidales bacterium]|nr:archaemetzincin family Zn-dependent metalloprotease [Bacteroidales bacterium]